MLSWEKKRMADLGQLTRLCQTNRGKKHNTTQMVPASRHCLLVLCAAAESHQGHPIWHNPVPDFPMMLSCWSASFYRATPACMLAQSGWGQCVMSNTLCTSSAGWSVSSTGQTDFSRIDSPWQQHISNFEKKQLTENDQKNAIQLHYSSNWDLSRTGVNFSPPGSRN